MNLMGFEPIFKQRKCSVLTVRRQVILFETIIHQKFMSAVGIEPTTQCFSDICSTSELHRKNINTKLQLQTEGFEPSRKIHWFLKPACLPISPCLCILKINKVFYAFYRTRTYMVNLEG